MDYSQVTICSYCRVEANYLVQTLPSWLNFPVKNILITDWGSNPPLVNRLKEVTTDSRVLVFRVENLGHSWLSKMKNIVGDYSTTDFIMFIEPFIWLRKFDFEPDPKTFYHGGGCAKSCCYISKEAYFRTYGYNEYYITSVGTEDDFADRLVKKGFTGEIMPEGMEHIDHEPFSPGTVHVKEPDIGKVWGRMCKKTPVAYTIQSLLG